MSSILTPTHKGSTQTTSRAVDSPPLESEHRPLFSLVGPLDSLFHPAQDGSPQADKAKEALSSTVAFKERRAAGERSSVFLGGQRDKGSAGSSARVVFAPESAIIVNAFSPKKEHRPSGGSDSRNSISTPHNMFSFQFSYEDPPPGTTPTDTGPSALPLLVEAELEENVEESAHIASPFHRMRLPRIGGVLQRQGVKLGGSKIVQQWIHAEAKTLIPPQETSSVGRHLSTVGQLQRDDLLGFSPNQRPQPLLTPEEGDFMEAPARCIVAADQRASVHTVRRIHKRSRSRTSAQRHQRLISPSHRSVSPVSVWMPLKGPAAAPSASTPPLVVHPTAPPHLVELVRPTPPSPAGVKRENEANDSQVEDEDEPQQLVCHSSSPQRMLPPVTFAFPTSSELEELAMRRCIEEVQSEAISGQAGLRLALLLYRMVIQTNPTYKHIPPLLTHERRFAALSTRAVVACVLLEKIVDSLDRHRSALLPFVEILFRLFLVPHTPEIKEALGGITYPAVLEGLGVKRRKAATPRKNAGLVSPQHRSGRPMGAAAGGGGGEGGEFSRPTPISTSWDVPLKGGETPLMSHLSPLRSAPPSIRLSKESLVSGPVGTLQDSAAPISLFRHPTPAGGDDVLKSGSSGTETTHNDKNPPALGISSLSSPRKVGDSHPVSFAPELEDNQMVLSRPTIATNGSATTTTVVPAGTFARVLPLVHQVRPPVRMVDPRVHTWKNVPLNAVPLLLPDKPENGEKENEKAKDQDKPREGEAALSPHRLGTPLPDQLDDLIFNLLQPFCRKPFLVAHMELSRRAVMLSHLVRSQRLHVDQLAHLFSFTYLHWSKTQLRSVLRTWFKLCRERKEKELQKRQLWTRQRHHDSLRFAVGYWRGYAALKLRVCLQDFETKASIQAALEEAKECRTLIAELEAQKKDLIRQTTLQRATLEGLEERIATRLSEYHTTLERVREMDRVGTLLLSSLLLKDAMPPEWSEATMEEPTSAAHQLQSVRSVSSSVSCHSAAVLEELKEAAQEEEDASSSCSETSLTSSIGFVTAPRAAVALQQQHQCMALRVLVLWAHQRILSEKAVEMQSKVDAFLKDGVPSANSFSMGSSHPFLSHQSSMQRGLSLSSSMGFGKVKGFRKNPFVSLIDESQPLFTAPLYLFLLLMVSFGPEDINTPSLAMVATVKKEDAAILKAMGKSSEWLDAAQGNQENEDPGEGGGRVQRVNASVYERSVEVARLLHNAYEALTGTVSPVTIPQLASRQRPYLVMLLAGLMRHYTSWVTRRLKRDVATVFDEEPSVMDEDTVESVESVKEETEEEAPWPAALMYREQRHPRHPELTWPPESHKQWRAKVGLHRRWISYSISALNVSLHHIVRAGTDAGNDEGTMQQNELMQYFLRHLSILSLSDLLSASSERTATFVQLVMVVKRYFWQLRTAFQAHALPYRNIAKHMERVLESNGGIKLPIATNYSGKDRLHSFVTFDEGVTDSDSDNEERTAGGVELEKSITKKKKKKGKRRKSTVEEDPALPASPLIRADDALRITVNQFWRMLVHAGIAGDAGSPYDASTTLHRTAVWSIVEHVVFRSLTPKTIQGAISQQSSDMYSDGSTTLPPAARPIARPPSAQQRLGKVRQSPHFARAIQESRHVDLRSHRGTVAMDFSQFIEALLRCAHAWQCLRCEVGTNSNEEGEGERGKELQPHSPPDPFKSSGGTDSPPSVPSPLTEDVPIRYETTWHYNTDNLQPEVLETFLRHWVLPPVIHSLRLHHPFRHALRDVRVRTSLAVWQDPLYAMFSRFATPREALGMRSALPPPFSNHVPFLLHPTQSKKKPGQSLETLPTSVGEEEAGQRESRRNSLNSAVGIETVAAPRDVGIVSVITLRGALQMMKELGWASRGSRLNTEVVTHCFMSSLSDRRREGGVMFFSEFPEFLCALAMYHRVNPKEPLYAKLNDFLIERIFLD